VNVRRTINIAIYIKLPLIDTKKVTKQI